MLRLAQRPIIANLIGHIPAKRRRRLRHPAWLGTLRRTTPLSTNYGYDRGTPIDRFYIESFLASHQNDIRGRVLEIKDRSYTLRFGVNIERTDVLDVDSDNSQATIVADLSAADNVASDQFDCFILTQTLQLIYDVTAAIDHAHRFLRPGGVLLVTVPSVSRVVPGWGQELDFWRFTAASCRALFSGIFGPEQCTIESFGNVLTGIAFLTGMAAEELSQRELLEQDIDFPVVLAVRAVKR